MTQKQSVVIIGGGPAGLTAAWELVKDGGSEQYDVTVLEATREFGGISRTVKHDGNRMDIGGHRFFSKDDRIMDWWKDVLPLQGAPSYDDKKLHREHDMEPGGPDPEIEDKVMLKRHRVSRIYWNRHFLDYPISLSANTLKAMGFKLTMVAGFSYLKSMVHKLPETNLENFYINRFGRKLYSMFFEGYTEKLWGRHPSEISADWGAQRVKGLSIMGVLKNAFQKLLPKKRDNSEVETSLIEEFWYPKLGPGQLWETVESNCEAAGVKVITDANVVEIRQKDGKIASVVYEDSEGNRTEMAADDFISSMPVKDLVNAVDASDQPAPKDMTEIANGLPYRDFVTVGLLVKHLRLTNTTDIPTLGNPPIVPDCWIYVQDPGYKVGRLQISTTGARTWQGRRQHRVDRPRILLRGRRLLLEHDRRGSHQVRHPGAHPHAGHQRPAGRARLPPRTRQEGLPGLLRHLRPHARTRRLPRLLRQPVLRWP